VIFIVCYFAGGVPGAPHPNSLVSFLKEIIACVASDGRWDAAMSCLQLKYSEPGMRVLCNVACLLDTV
jgi:hypothetical protein